MKARLFPLLGALPLLGLGPLVSNASGEPDGPGVARAGADNGRGMVAIEGRPRLGSIWGAVYGRIGY